jgi:hypothetical protein
MRNIFMLYMPPGNPEAMVHYEDTIHKRVESERIFPHVPASMARKLQQVFGDKRIAVWGSRDTTSNRAKFERMSEGDEILIVKGSMIKLLGKVACKTVSPSLSRELWKNLRGDSPEGWDLIYFIANPEEIELPFSKFRGLFGYQSNFQLRGFTSVAAKKLQTFYAVYDDLYSILLRLKEGKEIEEIPNPDLLQEERLQEAGEAAGKPTDLPEAPDEQTLSQHLRMQWLLLKMGKQAGQRVWAPRSDQGRISSQFNFHDFEETFAAGLDTQTKYVENIDVVWKEEFRIDAAFEIENSTSIYSGILRFADLTMVAPNSTYPMFIVAPSERRNRVREQLARPTFRHLHLTDKVHYLPYEKVDEINAFFGETGSGLNVNVLVGKSEKLKD